MSADAPEAGISGENGNGTRAGTVTEKTKNIETSAEATPEVEGSKKAEGCLHYRFPCFLLEIKA